MLNDAISIYFADATLASAFVARWCAGHKVEAAGGVFQVRENEPRLRSELRCTGHHERRRRDFALRVRAGRPYEPSAAVSHFYALATFLNRYCVLRPVFGDNDAQSRVLVDFDPRHLWRDGD